MPLLPYRPQTDARARETGRRRGRVPRPVDRRVVVRAGWALFAVAAAWHVAMTVAEPAMRWTMADLEVYRAAVPAAFSGAQVYDTGFGASGLAFLYPPFALVVLEPLSVAPDAVAKLAMSLLSTAALGVLCWRSWQVVGVRRQWVYPASVATAAVLLVSEPMQQNLQMGQVNVVLAALVLVDFLLPRGHRAKGVLVGLAAGIKLTPALFAVHYLLTRQWRAARNAALSFAASVAVGALVLPGASWTFWTQEVYQTRIGPGQLGNQSLLGVLTRAGTALGWTQSTVRLAWLGAAVVVAAAGLWLASRLRRDRLATYSVLALTVLLVSPLSWTPHWISLAPLVVWLAVRPVRPAARVVTLAGLGLLLAAWPVDGVPSGLLWLVYPAAFRAAGAPAWHTIAYDVVGNLYVLLGVVATVAFWLGRPRRTAPAQTPTTPRPATALRQGAALLP